MTIQDFLQKQSLPYEAKLVHAQLRAEEFRDWALEHDKNICISIGGLDSITLYYFLKSIGISTTPISVSVLEDKSIQKIHKQIPGMIFIRPYKSKTQVLKEHGFPVISKAKASKIENLQKPDSPKQTFIHAIMTGDMGEQGKFQHSNKIKLPEKWIKQFGGLYADHRPDIEWQQHPTCGVADFKVSAECCKWMKEKPAQDWQKENNMVPYLGLMASEGGQREQGLMKNGCNYYGKSTIRSCPFAIFTRQDLLQLALDMDAKWINGWKQEAEMQARCEGWLADNESFADSIIPAIYGTIERNEDGTLYTTKAQRTGCNMCGFGIHIEKRPHRFDRLREASPKEWEYWMYNCCTNEVTGEKYGWGRVLDYIGIAWEDIYEESEKYEQLMMDI